MKFTKTSMAAAILAFIAFAVPAVYAHSLDSLSFTHLTSENYHRYMQDSRNLLVLFSVGWCHACQPIRNKWKAIGDQLKDSFITLAVDGDGEAYLKALYNIDAFPTVLLIDKQRNKYYEFDFNAKIGIPSWASYEYHKSPGKPIPTSVNLVLYVELLITNWYTRNPQSYYMVLAASFGTIILLRFMRKPKKPLSRPQTDEKKDIKKE